MPLRASSHPGSPNCPSCSALAWHSCLLGLFPWGRSGKRNPVARTAVVIRWRYPSRPPFLNENISTAIKISLKFVPKVQIDNSPALATRHCQIQLWLVYGRMYAPLGLNEFILWTTSRFYTVIDDNGEISDRWLYWGHERTCKKIIHGLARIIFSSLGRRYGNDHPFPSYAVEERCHKYRLW